MRAGCDSAAGSFVGVCNLADGGAGSVLCAHRHAPGSDVRNVGEIRLPSYCWASAGPVAPSFGTVVRRLPSRE